jgi:cytochrome c biogenesis protein CcdA
LVKFIIGIASWILSIVATIFFIVAIFVFFAEGIKAGISILIIAWLISPYGIPQLAQWIVDKTVDIKFYVKDKIS